MMSFVLNTNVNAQNVETKPKNISTNITLEK